MESTSDEVLGIFDRSEELLELLRKGRALTEEVLRENERLRDRVAMLEGNGAEQPPDGASENHVRLWHENARLREMVTTVDAENQHFARRSVEIEAQNESLANLYVATCQLHSSLDPDGVARSVEDIVVGLIGASEWAIFFVEDETGDLLVQMGEGVADRFPTGRVARGEGIEGRAAANGRSHVGEPGSPDEQTACLPLMLKGECLGLIAIYKLLSHKTGSFTPIDHELLNLLAGQAATALTSSRLYAARSRPIEEGRTV